MVTSTEVPLGPRNFWNTSSLVIPKADSPLISTIRSPALIPKLSAGVPGMGEITVKILF